MGIKQKLLLMGTLMALLVVAICGIGYYKAQTALMTSISGEIEANLSQQATKVDGWLARRGQIAESTCSLLSMYADRPELYEQSMLSLAASDKDVLDVCNGTEDGRFIRWAEGDVSALVNPHKRQWYNDAKAKGTLFFTEAYEDISNHQMVVSAAAPYKGADGAIRGAVCVDISLATLDTRVKNLKYHGEGQGIIVEPSGLIIASSEGMAMHKVDENPVLKENFPAMLQNKEGYFATEKDGEEQIIAYTTVPSSGWIVAIAVPESVAFAQLTSLKTTYAVLSLLGILLVAGLIFALMRFSATITGATARLKHHVDALAQGDLHLSDLPVTSQDELGQLAANFNVMMKSIRDVIRQVAGTAEQLAAASEQLTAGAHQMAESATEIAGTVANVAEGTDAQLESLAGAKKNIGIVSGDIERVTGKAERVAENSAETADAAQRGESLMNEAMTKMTGIEQSVLRSAEVVEKLGESSKQIGEIVETISAIAEQSREAADQIKERIESVQTDTAHAVAAMQSGTSEVQAGTDAIRAVGTQFESIMRMVDEIKEQMADISKSMQTVARGTELIVQSATTVNEITEKTADHMQNISSASQSQSASSEEIAAASQALATLATDLQNTTQKFTL